MNNNEKLIEEAASIVYGTVPASVIVPWHELDTNRRVEFEDAARAIRHVFEKAHTPTDDELEPITDEALWDFADDLLDSWNIEDQNLPSLAEDFRDRFVVRFRLRATEVLR